MTSVREYGKIRLILMPFRTNYELKIASIKCKAHISNHNFFQFCFIKSGNIFLDRNLWEKMRKMEKWNIITNWIFSKNAQKIRKIEKLKIMTKWIFSNRDKTLLRNPADISNLKIDAIMHALSKKSFLDTVSFKMTNTSIKLEHSGVLSRHNHSSIG